MVTRITKWVSLTAAVLVVSWRPSANYQILLHFWVCAGAVLVLLAANTAKVHILSKKYF